jgi:hypothetical protein
MGVAGISRNWPELAGREAMPSIGDLTSDQFGQWIANVDRRLHDLELYVLHQLADTLKTLDERVKALENPGG